jgi:hypothetical protein
MRFNLLHLERFIQIIQLKEKGYQHAPQQKQGQTKSEKAFAGCHHLHQPAR